MDILSALGTNLKDFFSEEPEEKIVFKEQEFIEKETTQYTLNWLVPNSQKNEMEPVLVDLMPKKNTEPDVPHEGEEFGYVLSGSVVIHLGKKKYKANKGESFYYQANKEHYIENNTDRVAKFIWVATPPTCGCVGTAAKYLNRRSNLWKKKKKSSNLSASKKLSTASRLWRT